MSYLYRMGTKQDATDDFTPSDILALKQGYPRSPVRQGGCSTYGTPELMWRMFRRALHSFQCDWTLSVITLALWWGPLSIFRV